MINTCKFGVDSVVGSRGEEVLSFVVVGIDRLENIVLEAILKHVNLSHTVIWDVRLSSRWWANRTDRAAIGVATRAGVAAAATIAVYVDGAGLVTKRVTRTSARTGARVCSSIEEGFCVH